MRIQTTIGSAKKLASFAEEKFGVGALSFSDSKSEEKNEKKIAQESGVGVWVPVIRLFLVEPMRTQTTIGSAKELASFAEENFGIGALSFSDSKREQKQKKKKNTFRNKRIPTTKMPAWQIIGAYFFCRANT